MQRELTKFANMTIDDLNINTYICPCTIKQTSHVNAQLSGRASLLSTWSIQWGHPDVPQSICSRGLRSPIPMFPGPMFPSATMFPDPYVSQYLCFPIHNGSPIPIFFFFFFFGGGGGGMKSVGTIY